MLINQIKYKAEEKGINVILQEESHTSKCSFLDDESVEHHDHHVGKRFKCGLFRSAGGIIINADVNGAYNIIKKAILKVVGNLRFLRTFTKAEADRIEGVGLHPLRCYIQKSKGFLICRTPFEHRKSPICRHLIKRFNDIFIKFHSLRRQKEFTV
jgi:putative transposase